MDVWRMLDDMAEKDPKGYQQFIHEQLQDGPPEVAQRRSFNPVPGLVVKCTMQTSNGKREKLFVNLCSHEIIDIPKNPNSDREVPRDTRAVPSTSNLQIPLVVGKRRSIKDFSGTECSAIDVVFHPWVLERCAWDASFKGDVLKLALHWVQQDAKLVLSPPTGKFIKSQYKGGVTVGGEILTSRFPITAGNQQTGELAGDDDGVTQNQREETAASIAMDSPSDLLKKMTLAKEEDEGKPEFLLAPVGDPPTSSASTRPKACCGIALHRKDEKPSAKKLIEVIDSKEDASKATTNKQSRKSKQSGSAVKRGFLNSTKAQLYPEGSSEGRPASAYVNLLSRSKVVDMTDLERQQAQQPDDRKTAKTSAEKDHGDHEFEQLCLAADPELDHSRDRSDEDVTRKLFGDDLEEFAKFLTSQS
ncbi:hypothetical protein P43SY_006861 [Pythium insidiosum]|uniref:PIH1 N-terminal domain-containing protein n=1 Tax=Pythium insidiosum TaxID=114742 RepID=A0AAD5Q9S4_PYTIN|nr:hypothetical protein P43SY_006861 [Pythium insidiosum]